MTDRPGNPVCNDPLNGSEPSALKGERRMEARFRKACSKFPTGVTVTTGRRDDGTPYGITVNSFTSVSLDPPLVLVCIDQRSRVLRDLTSSEFFGINILNECQQELSARFSRHSCEQFSNIAWHRGETGVPLLRDVSASLECRVTDTIVAGDHVIVIGRVLHMETCELAPLAYVNSSYTQLHSK